MKTHVVSFEELGRFKMINTNDGDSVSVRLDTDNYLSEVARLEIEIDDEGNKKLVHVMEYDSPIEFATVTMKQVLTLFVKRGVISRYPSSYKTDDPKVHSYVSKLSYEGIKFVANNLDEFAKQFNAGNVTMDIPKNRFDANKHARSC